MNRAAAKQAILNHLLSRNPEQYASVAQRLNGGSYILPDNRVAQRLENGSYLLPEGLIQRLSDGSWIFPDNLGHHLAKEYQREEPSVFGHGPDHANWSSRLAAHWNRAEARGETIGEDEKDEAEGWLRSGKHMVWRDPETKSWMASHEDHFPHKDALGVEFYERDGVQQYAMGAPNPNRPGKRLPHEHEYSEKVPAKQAAIGVDGKVFYPGQRYPRGARLVSIDQVAKQKRAPRQKKVVEGIPREGAAQTTTAEKPPSEAPVVPPPSAAPAAEKPAERPVPWEKPAEEPAAAPAPVQPAAEEAKKAPRQPRLPGVPPTVTQKPPATGTPAAEVKSEVQKPAEPESKPAGTAPGVVPTVGDEGAPPAAGPAEQAPGAQPTVEPVGPQAGTPSPAAEPGVTTPSGQPVEASPPGHHGATPGAADWLAAAQAHMKAGVINSDPYAIAGTVANLQSNFSPDELRHIYNKMQLGKNLPPGTPTQNAIEIVRAVVTGASANKPTPLAAEHHRNMWQNLAASNLPIEAKKAIHSALSSDDPFRSLKRIMTPQEAQMTARVLKIPLPETERGGPQLTDPAYKGLLAKKIIDRLKQGGPEPQTVTPSAPAQPPPSDAAKGGHIPRPGFWKNPGESIKKFTTHHGLASDFYRDRGNGEVEVNPKYDKDRAVAKAVAAMNKDVGRAEKALKTHKGRLNAARKSFRTDEWNAEYRKLNSELNKTRIRHENNVREALAGVVKTASESQSSQPKQVAPPPTVPPVQPARPLPAPGGGRAAGPTMTTPSPAPVPPVAEKPPVPGVTPAPQPSTPTPGAGSPSAAPAATPTPPQKPRDPGSTLQIGRGMNGNVQVAFPDRLHADLYALPGRMRRQMQGKVGILPAWKEIAQNLGVPEYKIFDVARAYKDKVNQSIKGLPEGERFEAPHFSGGAPATAPVAAPSQPVPPTQTPPTVPPVTTPATAEQPPDDAALVRDQLAFDKRGPQREEESEFPSGIRGTDKQQMETARADHVNELWQKTNGGKTLLPRGANEHQDKLYQYINALIRGGYISPEWTSGRMRAALDKHSEDSLKEELAKRIQPQPAPPPTPASPVAPTAPAAQPEQLPGGKGDRVPDSAVPADQLAKGIQTEMEHTNDPAKAKEIAKDHITGEGEDYYDKLPKMKAELKPPAGQPEGDPLSAVAGRPGWDKPYENRGGQAVDYVSPKGGVFAIKHIEGDSRPFTLYQGGKIIGEYTDVNAAMTDAERGQGNISQQKDYGGPTAKRFVGEDAILEAFRIHDPTSGPRNLVPLKTIRNHALSQGTSPHNFDVALQNLQDKGQLRLSGDHVSKTGGESPPEEGTPPEPPSGGQPKPPPNPSFTANLKPPGGGDKSNEGSAWEEAKAKAAEAPAPTPAPTASPESPSKPAEAPKTAEKVAPTVHPRTVGPPAVKPTDIADFIKAEHGKAPKEMTPWPGKVFIQHFADKYLAEHPGVTREQFNQALIGANQQEGFLSRYDMQTKDPVRQDLINKSALQHLNSTNNLVTDPEVAAGKPSKWGTKPPEEEEPPAGGVKLKSPLLESQQRTLDDPSAPLADRIKAAAGADRRTFDALVMTPEAEGAGLEHNEALRLLEQRYLMRKSEIAAGGLDPKKYPSDAKHINDSMDSTVVTIKRRIESLRKLGKDEAADWYEKVGLPLVEEARADLLGKPATGEAGVDKKTLDLWRQSNAERMTTGAPEVSLEKFLEAKKDAESQQIESDIPPEATELLPEGLADELTYAEEAEAIKRGMTGESEAEHETSDWVWTNPLTGKMPTGKMPTVQPSESTLKGNIHAKGSADMAVNAGLPDDFYAGKAVRGMMPVNLKYDPEGKIAAVGPARSAKKREELRVALQEAVARAHQAPEAESPAEQFPATPVGSPTPAPPSPAIPSPGTPTLPTQTGLSGFAAPTADPRSEMPSKNASHRELREAFENAVRSGQQELQASKVPQQHMPFKVDAAIRNAAGALRKSPKGDDGLSGMSADKLRGFLYDVQDARRILREAEHKHASAAPTAEPGEPPQPAGEPAEQKVKGETVPVAGLSP